MSTTIRLFKPHGPDHVAVVSVQPSWTHAGAPMISVARGPRSKKLSQAELYGPFAADDLDARLAEAVDRLRAEGYGRSGLDAMLAALSAPEPRSRAHAALRLGWLREKVAVEALLKAAEGAHEEIGSIVEALGALGDPRSIPLARREAERKLLSRRRAGVEALLALGDGHGLAEARARALERLPDPVRAALAALDENDRRPESADLVAKALLSAPEKERGLAADTLYELGSSLAVEAARQALRSLRIDEPFIWRYAKSVLKRAMVRHDAPTFGWLVHRVEHVGRESPGTKASLKSGYDGQVRTTAVFGRKTREYVRRRGWRYLRRLALHRPELYTGAAAEAIVHYSADDEGTPRGLFGAFASCYLLNRVLWGASLRLQLVSGSLRFRFQGAGLTRAPADAREESFPDLWDAHPRPYLRLLGGSRLIDVQLFALRALETRHPEVLEAASHAEVAALLAAPHEPTVALGLRELRRRFDPTNPDWSLVSTLLADSRPVIRDLGLEWITATAGLWTRDADRILAFLGTGDPTVRAAVARLAIAELPAAGSEVRRALAARLLDVLRSSEPAEGAHEFQGQVAREALADEMGALLTLDEVMALLSSPSLAARGAGAAVLARRPDAATALGLPRVVALAQDPTAAVRAAGHALLRAALPQLAADPSPLFALAESEWADTRAVAVDLLRSHIDLLGLGADALFGLCDSTRVEVQDLGQELVRRERATLDPVLVIDRLTEHPHPNMRRFTLDLVKEHLDDGLARLRAPEAFFRRALFELRPDRQVKRRVLALLADSGVRDEAQAKMAIGVLADVVRTKTREDFEDALTALVRIKLAFPHLEMPVTLPGEAGA